MKCPVCQRGRLQRHQLEADLPAYQCNKCAGIWISAAQYWKWIKTRGEMPSEPSIAVGDVETPLPLEEATQAKICPGCGHILRRYQVWPETKFYLDRCGTCESVWFDRDEWAVVKARDLHDRVHWFFSAGWQKKIKEAESRRWLVRMYQERFGEEEYARLKELRAWLDAHPKRTLLLAYLSDRDPYRI